MTQPTDPKLLKEIKKKAEAEMEAFATLPKPIQDILRHSNMGWQSKTILMIYERLDYDVNKTIYAIRQMNLQFSLNQIPNEVKVKV